MPRCEVAAWLLAGSSPPSRRGDGRMKPAVEDRGIQEQMPRPSELLRYGLLSLPPLFVGGFLLVPVGLTFVISFWERRGFSLRPALSFAAYAAFFSGVRLEVLQISLLLAIIVTLLGLLLAYPV